MPFKWEIPAACNFCGGGDTKPYMESLVPPWYEGRPLTLVECEGCGLVRAAPRPEREGLYKSYISAADNVKEIVRRKLERPNVGLHHRRAIEEAMKYCASPPKRLYDMGCGAGTIMVEARGLGLEAEGNDINLAAIQMLREMGFQAYHGFTRAVSLQNDSYDIVMNLDYLEHSYEPLDDLKTCYKILKPGGVLYLKTLYLGCPAHKEEGEGWKLFGNGHFHYFFPETLRKMVESVGFEVAELKLGGLITVIGRK